MEEIQPVVGEGMETAVSVRAIQTQGETRKEIQKTFKTIRPELNVEKHADFFFAPSHSKNLHKSRSRSWTEALPDGTRVKANIQLEPFQGKIPTTKTRKVYLALQQIWEEKGSNESGDTSFSINQVSDVLGLKWAGKKTLRDIRNELRQLAGTTSIWQHSFVNEQGQRVSLEQPFRILENYRLFTKEARDSKHLYLAISTFRFHEEIRKNLLANRTKPTNLVALELQGEIASVLYARLDIILADKTYYERTTAGLFEDINLEGIGYNKPSIRRQKVEKAIKELEGKPISTGILHLCLEKTANGKDWKLVATKELFPSKNNKLRFVFAQRVAPPNPPEVIPYLAEDIGRTIGQQNSNHPLYILLCKTYAADLLYQALSEWKADGGRQAKNPRGYFMAIMHRIAHQHGKLWINKNCSDDCKYRPLLS